MKITLNDDNGQPTVVISNCHQDDLVSIRFLDGLDSTEVSIEELKHALRKISHK